MTIRELLEGGVRARLSDPHAAWFERALQLAAHGTPVDLLHAYTEASRHLGRSSLALTMAVAPAELEAIVLEHWTVEDAGRLAFLLARHDAALDPTNFSADATACFEQGDSREQQSWLRGVSALPGADGFLSLVVDGCRTNILPLFEAIACENPYPARHFPERNFNQMVLKALFNGVALTRIVGLTIRANPELARMATDYAAERTSAGRSVPRDISLATAQATAQRTDR